MLAHTCYHCKQWVDEGETHDCWTTTEAALTTGLPEDLREAWDRLREAGAALGEQRIYASLKSIMFSRTSCYFFVRPKKAYLEVCVFLGRAVKHPLVRRVDAASKTKFYHMIRIEHRDQVEPPLTGWLEEAYKFAGSPTPKGQQQSKVTVKKTAAKKATQKQATSSKIVKKNLRAKSGHPLKRKDLLPNG